VRNMEHLRGAAEAPGGGHCPKGPELIQRHRHLFPAVIGLMKKYHWQLCAPASDYQPSITSRKVRHAAYSNHADQGPDHGTEATIGEAGGRCSLGGDEGRSSEYFALAGGSRA